MKIISEKYITKAGSIVQVTGKHLGIIDIDWDWFEEGACCDSHPVWDSGNKTIEAYCECCEDSPFCVSAELIEVVYD